MEEGGEAIARHPGRVCAVLVFGLLPRPSPPLTSYVVCCVVHMLPQKCVYAGGGGAHMSMPGSSVLVAMSVCVMHPPTHCDNLFFIFYLFYQSRLERSVF